MYKKVPLHIKILAGMALGIGLGLLSIIYPIGTFIQHWIKPFGSLFINALKLIAVPLVLFSLISGVSSVKDIGTLSKMGSKTIITYLITTVIAISIGLAMVNFIRPWEGFDQAKKENILGNYKECALEKSNDVERVKGEGPLRFLEDLVPPNLIAAASNNGNMLQVIVFALLFGVAMLAVPSEKALPVKQFFEGGTEVVLKMVDIIMKLAPLGTLALMASFISEQSAGDAAQAWSIIFVLGKYCITVMAGLAFMLLVVYPLFVYFSTGVKPLAFYKAIAPAQLLAFSTSSSAATLPLTMECVQDNLKVSKEVSGFVLPLGATINMDGTSCYQAIAAVFIANVMGFDLGWTDQLSIVLTATLASIGSAAVPGAGMIMLAIVLSHLGVPLEGIAIILGVDRILDMCRTVVNVTSDSAIAVFLGKKR